MALSDVLKKLEFIRREFDIDQTLNNFSDVLIKRMAESNTLHSSTSHQKHIALTGSDMDIFPYPGNYLYLEKGIREFKRHYLLKIPIKLVKKNLEYLLANLPAEYKTDSIFTKIKNTLQSKNKEIESFTTCVKSKRKDQSYQLEMSDKLKDDEWFINFRELIFEDDYLIFLRKKGEINYYLIGVKGKDAIKNNLNSITGYYLIVKKEFNI